MQERSGVFFCHITPGLGLEDKLSLISRRAICIFHICLVTVGLVTQLPVQEMRKAAAVGDREHPAAKTGIFQSKLFAFKK